MVGPFLARCLAHPLNADIALEVATAHRLGVPLSVARGSRLPADPWTPRDWALAQAVEILNRNRCPECGQPIWLSHDKQHRKHWRATAERCYSCDAIAARSEALAKGEVQRPESVKYGSVFTAPDWR